MKLHRFRVVVYGILILGLLAGSFALGWSFMPAPVVSAQEGSGNSPQALSATADFTCTLNQVGIIDNRIHIRCTTAPATTTIFYYAYPSTGLNSDQANRFLMVANTAYSLNKPIVVRYDTDSTHNIAGCAVNDCRNILMFFLNQ